MKPKTKVEVISDRCGTRGQVLVVLWKTDPCGQLYSMYGCRPIEERGWDGKPVFYSEIELREAN